LGRRSSSSPRQISSDLSIASSRSISIISSANRKQHRVRTVEKSDQVILCEGRKFHLRARSIRTSATIRTNPQIHIQPLFQPCIPMLYPFTNPPHESARESGTLSGSFRPIVGYPSNRLAAATLAGLWRRCRLAQVLRRTVIELLFALGAAKVIRLSSMLGVSSSGSCFYLHAANWVFHNCGAAHRVLLGL
jgi:hypothetical protein